MEHKGGTIASSFEESWCYTADGIAIREHDSNYEDSVYNWDGESFCHVSGQNCGTGKWDGVNLAWYTTSNATEPFIQYLLQDGQYTHWKSDTTDYDWKWTRHFLASMRAKGHWSVEGRVPQPVVMMLQVMRYVRNL
jgi:hypothetical protein